MSGAPSRRRPRNPRTEGFSAPPGPGRREEAPDALRRFEARRPVQLPRPHPLDDGFCPLGGRPRGPGVVFGCTRTRVTPALGTCR